MQAQSDVQLIEDLGGASTQVSTLLQDEPISIRLQKEVQLKAHIVKVVEEIVPNSTCGLQGSHNVLQGRTFRVVLPLTQEIISSTIICALYIGLVCVLTRRIDS